MFIDDVYSGGSAKDGDYPLLSEAISGGLFHPRCKDSTSTYYEGITTLKPATADEIDDMKRQEALEQQKSYYENQAKKCERISKYSLDSDNKQAYAKRAEVWQDKAERSDKVLKMGAKNIDLTIPATKSIDNPITAKELAEIQNRLSNIGVKNLNNAESLKTSVVIKPFVEQLEQLNDKYGKMFFRIDIVDLSDSDIAQVTPAKVLQLNKKYFNSSVEMDAIIKEFVKKCILPKGADIKYIATHEWGHFISMDDLNNPKSPMYTLFRRTKPKDFVSENAKINIHEYIADTISCSINKIPCKNTDKVLEYYLKGGSKYEF